MGKIEEIQRTLRQVVQFQNDQVINAKETEDFVSLDPLDGDAKVRATLNGESYFINVKDINNQRSRSNTPTQLISINIDNNDPEYINKKIADAVNLYPKTKIKDANNVIFYTIRFLGVSDIGYNFVQEYFSLKKEIPLSEDGFAYIGIEATQILEDDIIRISVVDNLNRVNQTFDLGDIGTQTVNEFVNGSGTYTTLTGTINIFKTIENTEEKEYLYTGSQQQIGAGTNAVSLSDFRLLTPETVDPIPPEIPQLTLTDESNNSVTGGLNVNFEGDVIVSQLPDGTLNVAVTSNASDIPPEDQYATVAALIADQNRQEDGNQYFVIDASGFTTVESGNAIVLKNGDFTGTETDYYIIKSKFAIEITDVNGLSAALASKATEAQGVKADTSVQLTGDQLIEGLKTFKDPVSFDNGGVRISYGMFQRWLGTTLIGTFAINEQGHFVLRNFIGSGFDALLRTDDLTENRIYDYPNNNGTLGLNINSVLEGEPAGSSIVKNVVSISQADYDAALAAGTLVATTQYLIPEA